MQSQGSLQLSRDCKDAALRNNILARYKTSHDFCLAFSPSVGSRLLSPENTVRAYTSKNCPTLETITSAYGYDTKENVTSAEYWLMAQIENVNEFCNSKIPLTEGMIKEVAILLYTKHKYLKVSEFMLFFARFKSGHYGTVYGSLKPKDIMDAFRRFLDERGNELEKIERDRSKKERNNAEKAVTREEYERLKNEGLLSRNNLA